MQQVSQQQLKNYLDRLPLSAERREALAASAQVQTQMQTQMQVQGISAADSSEEMMRHLHQVLSSKANQEQQGIAAVDNPAQDSGMARLQIAYPHLVAAPYVDGATSLGNLKSVFALGRRS